MDKLPTFILPQCYYTSKGPCTFYSIYYLILFSIKNNIFVKDYFPYYDNVEFHGTLWLLSMLANRQWIQYFLGMFVFSAPLTLLFYFLFLNIVRHSNINLPVNLEDNWRPNIQMTKCRAIWLLLMSLYGDHRICLFCCKSCENLTPHLLDF